MANFLLGLVGAAVGSAFGMPALGFSVGSGLGSALGHHSGAAPSAGARLSDLKVQTSTYGAAIPRLYGTYRIAGNIIWATELIEKSDASKTHYSYYAHFALGLCKGPVAGLRRVWADGKLLLEPPPDAPIDAILTTFPSWLRFYPGDESQGADPLLEKYRGVDQVPGFRGLAYLVFENFPLANFNNRLPTLTLEVVQTAVESPLPVQPLALPLAPPAKSADRMIRGYAPREARQQRTPLIISPLLQKNPWVAQPVTLASIVVDLCAEAGWAAEKVEASALTQAVRGFVLAGPSSAREALSFLQRAYGFTIIEREAALLCLPRGQEVAMPIGQAAVGATEEGQPPEDCLISRTPTSDLPQSVTVLFTDASQDYAMATQTAQRMATKATRAERLELPLALTSLEAARLAQRLLGEAWAARTQFAFSLSRHYAFLEPSDVVLLQNQRMRLTALDYGSPGLLKVKAVADMPL